MPANGDYAEQTISTYFSAGQVTVNVAAWSTKYVGTVLTPSLISSWNWVGAGTSTTTISSLSSSVNGGLAFGVSGSTANITGFTLEAISGCLLSNNSATATYTTLHLTGGGTGCIGLEAAGGTIFNNDTAVVVYSGSYAAVVSGRGGGSNLIGFGTTRSIVMTNSAATVATGFALANQAGTVAFVPAEVTFSGGNPTGPKFNSSNTGFIAVAGSGINYLPGSTAGTAQNTFNYA